jgi:hypothetical protein
MKRPIASVILLLAMAQSHAQLQPPARAIQPVATPTNVIIDRGVQLEIFPTQRAVPQSDSGGRQVIHRMMTASADSTIGPLQLGVVFNHAMQQQGYISGEIAFKMKEGLKLSGLTSSLYPGLKKITNPEVYVVNTRTPAEFMAVLKRLQGRDDLEWVEPTVIYGPLANGTSTR